MLSAAQLQPESRPLGLRHVVWVFTAPSRLFARVEDTGAYGWALVTLLVLITLIGYVKIQSGLIGRVVDEQTEKQLAQVEAAQLVLVDRSTLNERFDSVRKQGEFSKLLARLGAVVLSPVVMLASLLLIASVLFAVVALTGRKPEYHTLMSICVYAAFIELAAYLLQTGMMFYFRSLDVDTTLKGLAMGGAESLKPVLAGIDPFRIWFWILAAKGLRVTRQLSRRMSIVTCALLCLVAIGGHIALAFSAGGGVMG